MPPRFLASHLPGGERREAERRLRERPRLAEAGVVAEADRLRTRNGPGRGSGAGGGPRGNGPGGRWGPRRSSARRRRRRPAWRLPSSAAREGKPGGRRAAPRGVSGSRRCREGTAFTVPLRSPLVGRVFSPQTEGSGFPGLRPSGTACSEVTPSELGEVPELSCTAVTFIFSCQATAL